MTNQCLTNHLIEPILLPVSRLQHELKQSKPFPSRRAEAMVALLRTGDLARRLVEATVGPFGLTGQQYNVLRILRGAGEKGLPTLDIAERMIEQTPGITRLIDRLEAKQLVVRARCETDRRQVFCRITAEGLALLERCDAPIRAADESPLAGLSDADLHQLIDFLDRVRDGLDQQCNAMKQTVKGNTPS